MKGTRRKLFQYHIRLIGYLALWFYPVCLGQIVKVRVINQRDGQPLQKAKVSLSLLYEPGTETPSHFESVSQAETATDGQVKFSLPQPLPTHISVQVKFSSEHWRCACATLALS